MSWNKVIIEIVLFVLIGCIGMSLVMPVSALQKELPDKVIQVKEDKNIVYFTMCFEGTVKVYNSDSKWKTKDIITEYSMATGFHVSRSGHIFIPAHAIEYSEEEVKEVLLKEYIMCSKWFDEELFEHKTYLEYYYSDDAEQYFNELKEKLVDETLDIVIKNPLYRVYCPREEKPLRLEEGDIKFKGSTKDKDIVIFKTKVTDNSVIFNKDFKYEEGTKLYTIHYAEHTIYDYVDDIVNERESCPSEYKDVLIKAKEKMFEKIKDRGADIESGYLGTTTLFWGATKTYRFTGYTPAGSSGAPVLDENGHCVGMIVCGRELSEGVIDPTNAYFIPYIDSEEVDLKDISDEKGVKTEESESIIEKIGVNWLEIILGVTTVVFGPIIWLWGIKKKNRIILWVNKKTGLVVRRIRYAIGMYLFSWVIPGHEDERLLRFLRDDLDIGWAENAKISKTDNGKTIRIVKGENSAEIMLDEKKEEATLRINGTPHDLRVKKKNGKLNIYYKGIKSRRSKK